MFSLCNALEETNYTNYRNDSIEYYLKYKALTYVDSLVKRNINNANRGIDNKFFSRVRFVIYSHGWYTKHED